MIRHWLKLILLALLVLIQTACPKYMAKQNDDSKFNRFDQPREHG
jgi:hypothetical protein